MCFACFALQGLQQLKLSFGCSCSPGHVDHGLAGHSAAAAAALLACLNNTVYHCVTLTLPYVLPGSSVLCRTQACPPVGPVAQALLMTRTMCSVRLLLYMVTGSTYTACAAGAAS